MERQIRDRSKDSPPRWRHKAKVKLGPTRSFGRDALRRVLARNARGQGPSGVCWPAHFDFALRKDSSGKAKQIREACI